MGLRLNVNSCKRKKITPSKKEGHYLEFYSHFMNSDIIIGSPLALLNGIKSGNNDFLSSIDILCVDQFDSFMMQNIEALNELLGKHLNKLPRDANTDYSRVYQEYLDDPESLASILPR